MELAADIIDRRKKAPNGSSPFAPAVAGCDFGPTVHAPRSSLASDVDPSAAAIPLKSSPIELGAVKPTPPVGQDSRSGLLSLLTACAGHAVLVFALVYAVGTAGRPSGDSETPVEIEIIVEASAQTAPEMAPEPVIEVELPPPTPEPVIEVASPQPRPATEAPSAPASEPPPETALTEPVLTLSGPPPVPPRVDPVQQRLTAQRQIEERRRLEREQALRRERREERREAASEKAREAAQQRARATALRQAEQVHAGQSGSSGSPGPRGNNSMSIDAFRAAVAARIARNKPAASTASAAQGLVVVAFSVTSSGAAAGIRVASSSGHGVLDQAALAAVRRASPFPAPPPGAPRSFSVPMRFNTR